MADPTPLDRAFDAMERAPDDDAARLRFYAMLASSELFLLLEEEAGGDTVSPRLWDADGQSYALVFDREARLSDLAGGPAPFAALSGRVLAGMLAAERIGMALNMQVAPSSVLIPAEAVAWLSDSLPGDEGPIEKRPEAVFAPRDLPEALLSALDARLAMAEGRARCAYLVGVRYADGTGGTLLAVIDPLPGAEAALARSVAEAIAFLDDAEAVLDVAFFASDDPVTARLAKEGLRFDLPRPAPQVPAAPGMDPEKPPKIT